MVLIPMHLLAPTWYVNISLKFLTYSDGVCGEKLFGGNIAILLFLSA